MIRLVMALPLALGMALGLFSLMAWMVDNGHHSRSNEDTGLAFQMLMVEPPSETQRKSRSVPPPPEPPPETKPMASNTAAKAVQPMVSMPDFALETAISGVMITAPTFGDFAHSSGPVGDSKQAMPLYRVEPRFPTRALRQKLEGYVLLTFTIDTQGRPTDIVVTDSQPRRVFDKEALRAVRKWKYQPQIQGGKPVTQLGQTVRLEFKLHK